ncbi:MAG: lysoplasmalogenase [Bacteroidota bacterium]
MKSLALLILWCFALCLLIHCFAIYEELPFLRIVSKLFLLPMLIIYLYLDSWAHNRDVSSLAIAGLILSFIGDTILTQPGQTMFLIGMLAFIGTHICNSFYFLHLQKGGESRYGIMLASALILLVVSVAVFWLLHAVLGNMQVPIGVYMAFISTMAVLATGVYRKETVRKAAIRFFIPGAFLFVVSDAVLALNKFSLHNTQADIVVMLTYGLAQYFLVRGFATAGNK